MIKAAYAHCFTLLKDSTPLNCHPYSKAYKAPVKVHESALESANQSSLAEYGNEISQAKCM